MRKVLLGALVLLSSSVAWGSDLEKRTVYLEQSKNGCFEYKGERYNVAVLLAFKHYTLEENEKNHLAVDSLRVFNNIRTFGKREVDLGLIPKAFDPEATFSMEKGAKTYADQFFGDESSPLLTKENQEDVKKRVRWLVLNKVHMCATRSQISPIFTFLGAHNTGNKQDVLLEIFRRSSPGNLSISIAESAQKYFQEKTAQKGADKKEIQKDVIARLQILYDARMADPQLAQWITYSKDTDALNNPEQYFSTQEKSAEGTKSQKGKKRTRG